MFTVLYWLGKNGISDVELWRLFWIISIVFYFGLSYFWKRKMRSTLKDFLIVEFSLDLMWAILFLLNDSFIIECGMAMRHGVLVWMFCAWIFLLAEKMAASKIKIRIAMYSF